MDWNQLEDEATKYLQNYIRINTVNPPGNEVEGARFFKKIFEAESIPCQLYEPSPGRGNILATLKGGPQLLEVRVTALTPDRVAFVWEGLPCSVKWPAPTRWPRLEMCPA